jgi:hypothetical protein
MLGLTALGKCKIKMLVDTSYMYLYASIFIQTFVK